MSKIRELSSLVADQIAAGEVVERPASVAKELVENALDAGARRIRITLDTLEEGGAPPAIIVEDDGAGMDRTDLELSVRRHTTSKISAFEDLERLSTLGFRGEALASIAAVSRLTLESRDGASQIGYRMVVEGGVIRERGPVSRDVGTRVSSEDLFVTVPPRLKALKSVGAEVSAIREAVGALAVTRPEVAFVLVQNGDTLFATPGDGVLRHAVAAVFGADRADKALAVTGTALGGAITVTGLILPPDQARGNRSAQVVGVNGRLVRNFGLRLAVEQAYDPLLPDRRYPQFFLAVTVDPADLDPNAHPTKAEVRLAHERAVQGVVRQAVGEALRTAPAFSLPVAGGVGEAGMRAAEGSPLMQTDWLLAGADDAGARPVLHQELAALVPIAQWALRYIIAQGPDVLYIIDQHAAQERVFYDQLRARAAEPVFSQPLLEPLRLSLTPREESLLRRAEASLGAAGFRIKDGGPGTVLIEEVPALLADAADLRLADQVMASLEAGEAGEHPVSWALDHRLATAACKAAVKANRPLSHVEMVDLIRAMAASENPRACPHGRPVILALTLDGVDKHFGRLGRR